MWGDDQGATDQPDRLTVQQAADRLGITQDAIRSRIKRGTLASEHEDGRVYVLVGDQGATDQLPGRDDHSAARMEDLREQVSYLRDQLRREQDAHAEARRLLAGALERIPALEPSESAEARSDRPGVSESTAEVQEGAERVSWWRRVFGL